MSILELILLGLLQGITEPIPVSSSGHLQILQAMFDLNLSSLGLEVLLNFGSLLAIIVIYRKMLKKVFSNSFKFVKTKDKAYQEDFKVFYYVVIATIPAAVVGLFFADQIDAIFSNPKLVGVMLLVTAVFLFMIRKFNFKKQTTELTIKEVIIIGCAQAVALIPGISRSGATIFGASMMKLSRKSAFDFSFLLYIPISTLALVASIKDILNFSALEIIIGIVVSFVGTYVALKLFYRIMLRGKLIYFSIYCLVMGIVAIIVL